MNIEERLAIFIRRLELAPPVGSAEEALKLVCRLIEEAEDEFCSVPRQEPPPLRFTGRMHAARRDRMRRLPQGTLRADTRRHRIYCQRDGSIRIEYVPEDTTIVTKVGKKQ